MRNKIKNLLAILSVILVVILSFNLTGCDKRPKLYILNWDEYRISGDVGGFYASYLRSRREI